MKPVITREIIRILRLAAVNLPVLAAGSCAIDTANTGLSDDDYVTVTFTLTSPTGNAPSTYAPTNIQDNTVYEVDLLLFKDNSGTETFVEHHYITAINNSADPKSFIAKLPKGEGYRIVILANAHASTDALLAGGDFKGVEKDVMLAQQVFTDTDGFGMTDKGVTFAGLPMWGETKALETITDYTRYIYVTLLRAVARIDVSNEAAAFSMTGVILYGRNTRGLVVPQKEHRLRGGTEGVSLPANPGRQNSEFPKYSAAAEKVISRIYTSEAAATNDLNLIEATAIVVEGNYDNTTYYYRIDFADDNDYMALTRNHRYHIRIKAVSGPGAQSPDEAYLNKQINIIAKIQVWKLSDISVDNLVYKLNVSESDKQIPYWSPDSHTINVYTDYPDGWTASVEYNGDPGEWLTNNRWSGAGNNTSPLELTLADNTNNRNTKLTAIIHITAGNMTKEIHVEKTGLVAYSQKTILGLGYNYGTYGYFLDCSASRMFVDAEVNFGTHPASTVLVETPFIYKMRFRDQVTTNNANKIGIKALLDEQPDIVVIGYYLDLDYYKEILKDYLDKKGVLIIFSDPGYGGQDFMQYVFNNQTITEQSVGGAGYIFPVNVADNNDPVLCGPFGDFRGANWGQDGSGTSGFTGLPEDEIVSYSNSMNCISHQIQTSSVVMFRHKTLNMFYVGDGGFISNDNGWIGDSNNQTVCPFAIDSDHKPTIRRYGPNSNYQVHNSFIFGNLMAWAIHQAEVDGINTIR